MISLPLLEFDIRGTKAVNAQKGEKTFLKDKTQNWIIPNASPFFGDPAKVAVYNAKGQKLTLNRDYFLEEEFEPFVKASGKRIVCFIRLSDPVVLQNEFITYDYQSIGAWFVPRNNLEEWLAQINSGGVHPVPWSMVFKVPPTLPSSYHTHNVYTEIGDWFELTFFFEQLEGIRLTRDPEISDKLKSAVDAAYELLYQTRDAQLAKLVEHDGNYSNPHQYDAFTVKLGNVDNFATATPLEDLAGVRNDVFSTPYGVIQLAKTYTPDTSGVMQNGILPLSSFGDGNYIPPNISGSFEGLGTETECSAICLEPEGFLMVLSNHFDGRTRGLYYSRIDDYNTPSPKHTFTNYRYIPPSLSNYSVNLNRVVMGSGNKVIMVGVTGENNWFISLTGGTLNPAAHQYVKCDMTTVMSAISDPGPGYTNSHGAVIHYMGDYLVLVQSVNYNSVGNAGYVNVPGRQYFFRVKTADVIAGKAVSWERINVTYNNYDGTLLSNQIYMQVVTPVSSGGVQVRLGPITVNPGFTFYANTNRVVSLSSSKAGVSGVYNFSLMSWYGLGYTGTATSNQSVSTVVETTYDFNPSTGVFVSKLKSPATSYDFTNPGTQPYLRYSPINHMMVATQRPATVLLDNGELISTALFDTQPGFPIWTMVLKQTGRDTAESVLNALLDPTVSPLQYTYSINPVIASPILSGTYPGSVAFEADGEIYGAINQVTHQREMFFRSVAGDYQVRASVKNLNVGNVLARPLSNSVYHTNLLTYDPVISFTGSAADLQTAAVDCGSASLSACAYSSLLYDTEGYFPYNSAFRAPAENNVLMSFPRTYSKVIDSVGKTATYSPTTFYGFRQEVIDQIKIFVPTSNAGTRGWCFSLNVLGGESGGMFSGMNMGIIQMAWEEESTLLCRVKLILVSFNVEAPNADHPSLHLITGFSILHTPLAVKASQSKLASTPAKQFLPFKYISQYPERPMLSLYRNGNTVKMSIVSPYYMDVGSPTPICNIFDVDLTTKQISNISSGGLNMGYGEYTAMIPKAGISDYTTKVVKNPGTTYPQPSGESWTCKVTGVSTTSYTIHPTGGFKVPSLLVVQGYGEGGIKGLMCTACRQQLSETITASDYQAAIASHYTYSPPYTPPPAVERWTCINTGASTTSYSQYPQSGNIKVPSFIKSTRDGREGGNYLNCTACGAFLGDYNSDNSQAVYANAINTHYIYSAKPDIPDDPDDVYTIPPSSNMYVNTGGAAALAQKTTSGVTAYYLGISGYPETGWLLYIQDQIRIMINGTIYIAKGGSIDLRDVDQAPQNKTFYLYITVEDDQPKYVLSAIALRKTNAFMRVATLTTNDLQILTIKREAPFMVSDLLLSYTREGGIIPVSSGYPQDKGTFIFLKQSELLP